MKLKLCTAIGNNLKFIGHVFNEVFKWKLIIQRKVYARAEYI